MYSNYKEEDEEEMEYERANYQYCFDQIKGNNNKLDYLDFGIFLFGLHFSMTNVMYGQNNVSQWCKDRYIDFESIYGNKMFYITYQHDQGTTNNLIKSKLCFNLIKDRVQYAFSQKKRLSISAPYMVQDHDQDQMEKSTKNDQIIQNKFEIIDFDAQYKQRFQKLKNQTGSIMIILQIEGYEGLYPLEAMKALVNNFHILHPDLEQLFIIAGGVDMTDECLDLFSDNLKNLPQKLTRLYLDFENNSELTSKSVRNLANRFVDLPPNLAIFGLNFNYCDFGFVGVKSLIKNFCNFPKKLMQVKFNLRGNEEVEPDIIDEDEDNKVKTNLIDSDEDIDNSYGSGNDMIIPYITLSSENMRFLPQYINSSNYSFGLQTRYIQPEHNKCAGGIFMNLAFYIFDICITSLEMQIPFSPKIQEKHFQINDKNMENQYGIKTFGFAHSNQSLEDGQESDESEVSIDDYGPIDSKLGRQYDLNMIYLIIKMKTTLFLSGINKGLNQSMLTLNFGQLKYDLTGICPKFEKILADKQKKKLLKIKSKAQKESQYAPMSMGF